MPYPAAYGEKPPRADADGSDQMPRSTFEYPSVNISPSSTATMSEHGDGLDPFRDSATSSRRESYIDPFEPHSTSRPPLSRPNANRTLSDLYSESPPATPQPHLRPGQVWLSGSRPESEITLASYPYARSPTPLVCIVSSLSVVTSANQQCPIAKYRRSDQNIDS
jgi:hypothetical protein